MNAANSFLLQTSAFAATGSGFWPNLEGSGGSSNNSASNAPVFQVQRIDNDQMRFIANDESVNFSDTNFTGSDTAFAGFPAGPVQVRTWVNGVPSVAVSTTLIVTPGITATPTAIGGISQATVNFTAAIDNGGAPITSHTATASPGGATASCTAPCTSIVFNPIAANTYTFSVVANNAAGSGPASPDSNSVIVTQVVGTTTTIAASAASVVGQSYAINVTVSAASGTPDGSVSVTDGSNSCGPATLSGGAASCNITWATAGSYNLTATYAPGVGSTFTASTSAPVAHLVNPANQVITNFVSTPISPAYSVGGTFSVSATPGASGIPLSFASTTASVCSVGATTATGATINILGAGTCALTVDEAGAPNYTDAPQVTLAVTISKATQTIIFGAAPSLVLSGSGNLSATATSGLVVSFTSTTGAVCTVSGNTVTALANGQCIIAADQTGDTNFSPAARVTQSIVIGAPTVAVSIPTLSSWMILLLGMLVAGAGVAVARRRITI
ncbi:IPTL-CTERM sorting domain-containing protein [Pseudolysobacter antarcticus]|uniref:IPTL-CTERM sorting domain-containing protein n=1 Tax=Pseudolysobacter antarcticus TaxID=2511995 RepID=UPI0013EE00E5|nr:IPTL-CTERM sorting domain-containing protein [Pseudolysobacter antarcticus]